MKQASLYVAFLEYYCAKGRIALSDEEVRKLWNCYVENGVSESHANILYSALMKEHRPARVEDKFVLLQDKTAKLFFSTGFSAVLSIVLPYTNLLSSDLTASKLLFTGLMKRS